MLLSGRALREDGGFVVPEDMAMVLRQRAEAIKVCYSTLAEEQQSDIRSGKTSETCDKCRVCCSAANVYEAILLDGVWQDCCRAVGIALPHPRSGGVKVPMAVSRLLGR
jgi:hypothetical protein